MYREIEPFFQGALIVATNSLPEPVSELREEARLLSNIAARESLGSDLLAQRNDRLVSLWLTERTDLPHIRMKKILDAQRGFRPTAVRGRPRSLPGFEAAQNTSIDRQFDELFDGTVTALRHVGRGIPDDVLDNDRDTISLSYERLLSPYGGLPSHVASILIAQEYAAFRLTNPFTVFTGVPVRYGFLDVSTLPSGADVTVDQAKWGASPVGMGVFAGKHKVYAEQGSLSGQEDVNVGAGSSSTVNLSLA